MTTIDCPKCEHEHQPSGSHEDDSGEWQCEECGHPFHVEIEYDPDYYTSCVTHEFGDWEQHEIRCEVVTARFCKHCLYCDLKPD